MSKLAEYTALIYGDRISEVYDDLYGDMVCVESITATLAELAGDGSALEFGSGTGRIALPMRDKGVEAHGIDASEAMVAGLRAK